jgi:glycogen debranching enzyme
MSGPIRPGFSIADIPFSYAGSWFGISPVIAEKVRADHLHLISHQGGLHPVLRLLPVRGTDEAGTGVVASPTCLVWAADAGRVEAVFESVDTVRLRGTGLGMAIHAARPTLTSFSGTYFYRDPVDGAFLFTDYGTGRRYRITVLSGAVAIAGEQALGTSERGITVADTEPWEVAIEEFDSARPAYRALLDFDDVVKAAEAQFDAFVDAVAPWRSLDTPAAELAAYVLWSATVRAAGFLARPAVLMSKHWMDKVWSWDHCFNALALADGRPDLAWHQFHLVFDHQDESGALPDSITHSEVLYNFVKPPIHGWTSARLRGRSRSADEADLALTYTSLARWTTFWLTARRVPGERLPHYQHGNDSGWDNATTFDEERLVQTADLASFLILQLRELAWLADALARREEAAQWAVTADELRAAMVEHLWTGERFVARSVTTFRTWTSESLLDLMPIVLGEELPAEIHTVLAERIRTHLTRFGLATERPTSTRYAADGYWRGPIWAPSTVLMEDGLRRAGHTDLADDISVRFRALCERSGFAENFDALSGAAQRDRAYTWTASAYLLLAAAHTERHRQVL